MRFRNAEISNWNIYFCCSMYDTQPAEYFFLTSIYDSGFSCDTRFIHGMWMCLCNSFGSFWFVFFSSAFSFIEFGCDGVVGRCAQFHISASMHPYIHWDEDVKKSPIFMLWIGFRIYTFFHSLSSVRSRRVCAHKIMHFNFEIRLSMSKCVWNGSIVCGQKAK